ncbi:MAG: hypothetical protein COW52_08345 [Nitrospirae bacterium CG17_big_fil_post_rev_8_21_14_2_50_50_9]|nr:MAG: hypothetical protein COW52_08345 [Nitrospirae bacterium CG17_big_fil_post_rev_8_21_14_2_50_50_9]
MKMATTFQSEKEFREMKGRLDALGLAYELISPAPGYALVGEPALVMDGETRMALFRRAGVEIPCSGWVEHRPSKIPIPGEDPPRFAEQPFIRAAITLLAPCVADPTKIRILADVSGDMGAVFPYLNTEMKEVFYNPQGQTLTFMEDYRMICLTPRGIAVAKADEIVDAWRVLEMISRRVNETWARRHEIEPSYEMRKKPPALEIYKRLPRTNCRSCGEATCLAFAVKVHAGELPVSLCTPVFEGEFQRFKDALLEICAGLGV